MVVDQNSFIPERPFFANKNFTFAKLSRTPCLSFAGPMLANNTSYEDSFTTCQITPENHGSLLGSLLSMQLASRNPFSGQISFAKFTGPPPSTCTLTFARSFAWLSRNFRDNITIHRPRPSAGGALKEKRRPGALVFGSRKASLLETWLLLLAFSGALLLPDPGRQWVAFTYNDYNTQLSRNFREIKFYFRELEKKLSRGFPTWHARLSELKLLTRTFRSITIYISVYMYICMFIYDRLCMYVYNISCFTRERKSKANTLETNAWAMWS